MYTKILDSFLEELKFEDEVTDDRELVNDIEALINKFDKS